MPLDMLAISGVLTVIDRGFLPLSILSIFSYLDLSLLKMMKQKSVLSSC